VYFLSCCVLVTILVDRVRSRGHLAPSRSTFQSTAPTFPGRWQPVKSVERTVAVPYKTKCSSGLLVRDDIAFSSAWHANVSGSPAPEERLPGLQIRGRKLQSRSNRARKRDLSQGERSVRDRARPHTLLIDAGSVVPLERREGLVEPRWFCRLPWVRRRLRMVRHGLVTTTQRWLGRLSARSEHCRGCRMRDADVVRAFEAREETATRSWGRSPIELAWRVCTGSMRGPAAGCRHMSARSEHHR
jgi:hypothetical protein